MIEYESLGRLNKSFEDEYVQCFRELLNSGWYILGKQVATFEEAFAQYCGTKHCIGVASGLPISQLSYLFFNVVLSQCW